MSLGGSGVSIGGVASLRVVGGFNMAGPCSGRSPGLKPLSTLNLGPLM